MFLPEEHLGLTECPGNEKCQWKVTIPCVKGKSTIATSEKIGTQFDYITVIYIYIYCFLRFCVCVCCCEFLRFLHTTHGYTVNGGVCIKWSPSIEGWAHIKIPTAPSIILPTFSLIYNLAGTRTNCFILLQCLEAWAMIKLFQSIRNRHEYIHINFIFYG